MRGQLLFETKTVFVYLATLFIFSSTTYAKPFADTSKSTVPHIVNIVNFIRLLEPRDSAITEDVLYQTVVKQVEILTQYHLKATFLLQYDALMDKRYQQLLSSLPKDQFEIGAWWEIPQPLVENAGMKWRGRYPWDWHADVGFSTGYTQAERIRLIDTYMIDFKKIFGYYPKSVASWFIDAYSINYMYQQYHIVASANCKDQYGTDGYTLWGGYWNQAYYPCKINSYMPAQNRSAQIPVPVFRMLGSDPVRQYDTGLGNTRQGVITLEPVYDFGGGDSAWVHWFLEQFVEGECLAFAYTQAGQENSFTWKAMEKGFTLQMPLIAQLRDEHKLSVQTMEESGKWFTSKYKLTPPTAISINKDLGESDKKTVWYNSRYYRVNLLWENNNLRIRDIHLFNENFPSLYETQKLTGNECRFFTLPFVGGYLWSKGDELAGLRVKANINGNIVSLDGTDPVIKKTPGGDLEIIWPLPSANASCSIICTERSLTISMAGNTALDWYLDLTTSNGAQLPFTKIEPQTARCSFEGFQYNIMARAGTFTKPGANVAIRIKPSNDKIILMLDEGR